MLLIRCEMRNALGGEVYAIELASYYLHLQARRLADDIPRPLFFVGEGRRLGQ